MQRRIPSQLKHVVCPAIVELFAGTCASHYMQQRDRCSSRRADGTTDCRSRGSSKATRLQLSGSGRRRCCVPVRSRGIAWRLGLLGAILLHHGVLRTAAALASRPTSTPGSVNGTRIVRLLRRSTTWRGEEHCQSRATQALASAQGALRLLVCAAGQTCSGLHNQNRRPHGLSQGAALCNVANNRRHGDKSSSRRGRADDQP